MTDINFRNTRLSPILPALAIVILTLLLFSFLLVRNTPAPIAAPSAEERLILYTSMQEEVYSPLVREFENRTGIWVSVKTGSSLSELSRVSSGGEADWDVILAPSDALEGCRRLFAPASDFAPARLLTPSDPLASPLSDQVIFPYSFSNISIIYNAKLVRLYPPDSWLSLLSPTWNGRTAFLDPQCTGEGFSFCQAIIPALSGYDINSQDELFQDFSDPYFTDTNELIRAVANGTYYIGVVSEDAALRASASGYDIAVVRPLEKTAPVTNGMAVLKDSSRKENAGEFLAFLLDETIQEYLSKRFFYCPLSEQSTPETEVYP